MTKGNNNLLRPAIQQSSDCDCHSGLQARMSLNAIFVVARKVLHFNPASQAFPPCGSAKCASTLCSRSAASVQLSTFNSPLSPLFFRLQHDIRHNHLLHRDTAVLEGVTIVADMAIGVVVIDEEIVVVGENIARREV